MVVCGGRVSHFLCFSWSAVATLVRAASRKLYRSVVGLHTSGSSAACVLQWQGWSCSVRNRPLLG